MKMTQDKITKALGVLVILILLWKLLAPSRSKFVSAEFPPSMSREDAEKLYHTTIDAITMDMDAQLNATKDRAKITELTNAGQKALSDLNTKYTEYTTKKN